MKFNLARARKKINAFNKKYTYAAPGLKIAVIFGLFFWYTWHRIDPDFGWHLQSGNYIRRHGIPAHDIYSYTAPHFRWIDFEWGNDVLVSVLYGAGGYLLAALVYAAAWTAALMIGAGRRSRLIILLMGLAAMLGYSGVRTVTWTVLGLAILLRMIASKSKAVRYSIPLLFLIWANLHAGFIAGLAVIAYYAVKERRRSWLYILAGCFLLTLINPYGPRLYGEIFRTLSDRELHNQIDEWYYLTMPFLSWGYLAMWAAGFWLFTRKKISDWLGLSFILLLTSLSANRNVPLFVVASVRDLDKYYSLARAKLPRELDWPRKLIVGCFLGLIFTALALGLANNYLPLNRDRLQVYPVQAVAYLRSHPCSGNLFNDYDYGGYLIWQLPGKPVYIDGRMPIWKDSTGHRYIDTYFAVLSNKDEQDSQFKKYDVQCALLKNKHDDQPIIKRLDKTGWKLVVRSNGSFLFLAPAN